MRALFLLFLLHVRQTTSFVPRLLQSWGVASSSSSSTRISQKATEQDVAPDVVSLTPTETAAFDFLKGICDSGFQFRVVVVGKAGAILETTTPCLGPVAKVSRSPATGSNLVTFASDDQLFEFHVQLAQVKKITLLEKETATKTMRIIRIMNESDISMASLILADPSDAASEWFNDMVKTSGNEVIM